MCDYRILGDIQRGSYGSVCKIEMKESLFDTTTEEVMVKGEIYAMKIYKNNDDNDYIREVNILHGFSHPHIIRPIHSISLIGEPSRIIMELCQIDLDLYIYHGMEMTNQDKERYMHQLLSAMKFLHSHKIIHEDVKLANIMVVDGFPVENRSVKLIDFGLSNFVPSSGIVYQCSQSEPYRPPESKGRNMFWHSYESDVWALGLCFFEMWVEKALCREYHEICSSSLDFEQEMIEEKVPSKIIGVIMKMLTDEPSERSPSSDVLSHFDDYMEIEGKFNGDDIIIKWPLVVSGARDFVIEWLWNLWSSICQENKRVYFPHEQFFLGVSVIDRFITIGHSKNKITREHLQVTALASLSISSDIYPPEISPDLLESVCENEMTKFNIFTAKKIIGSTLEWKIYHPLPKIDDEKITDVVKEYMFCPDLEKIVMNI